MAADSSCHALPPCFEGLSLSESNLEGEGRGAEFHLLALWLRLRPSSDLQLKVTADQDGQRLNSQLTAPVSNQGSVPVGLQRRLLHFQLLIIKSAGLQRVQPLKYL